MHTKYKYNVYTNIHTTLPKALMQGSQKQGLKLLFSFGNMELLFPGFAFVEQKS